MKRTGVVGNSSFIVNDNDVIVVDDSPRRAFTSY
jgi:hypothetical protein